MFCVYFANDPIFSENRCKCVQSFAITQQEDIWNDLHNSKKEICAYLD